MQAPVHRVMGRMGNRVQCRVTEVIVPRCRYCERTHLAIYSLMWIFGVMGVVAGIVSAPFVLAVVSARQIDFRLGLLGLVVCGGIGAFWAISPAMCWPS